MNIIRYAVMGEMVILLACSYFVYWFNKEELKRNTPAIRWMFVVFLGLVFGVAIAVFIETFPRNNPSDGAVVLGIYMLPFLVIALYAVHLSLEKYYRVMNNDEREMHMSDTTPTPPTTQLKPTKAQVGAVIALAIAGALVLYTALDDGQVTMQEWVGIFLAVLGSPAAVGAGVYHTTNKPK